MFCFFYKIIGYNRKRVKKGGEKGSIYLPAKFKAEIDEVKVDVREEHFEKAHKALA